MRSRDFAVLVLNRIEQTGVCPFCDEHRTQLAHKQHAHGCPVAEYLRTESQRRHEKTERDRSSSLLAGARKSLVEARVDRPTTMYGTTWEAKRANVHAHHHDDDDYYVDESKEPEPIPIFRRAIVDDREVDVVDAVLTLADADQNDEGWNQAADAIADEAEGERNG